jgi:hypothetical protein
MEGYLQKYTNLLYGYKKRYFVLKGNILYYYKKKGEKVKGKIHLAITVINSKSSNLILLDTGIKNVTLKCDSNQERDKWFNAMQMAKFEAASGGTIKPQINKIITDKETEKSDDNKIILGEENNMFSSNVEHQLNELKSKIEAMKKNNEKLDMLIKDKSEKVNKDILKQIYSGNQSELSLINTQLEFLTSSFKKLINQIPDSSISRSISNSPAKRSTTSQFGKGYGTNNINMNNMNGINIPSFNNINLTSKFDMANMSPSQKAAQLRKHSDNNIILSKRLKYEENFEEIVNQKPEDLDSSLEMPLDDDLDQGTQGRSPDCKLPPENKTNLRESIISMRSAQNNKNSNEKEINSPVHQHTVSKFKVLSPVDVIHRNSNLQRIESKREIENQQENYFENENKCENPQQVQDDHVNESDIFYEAMDSLNMTRRLPTMSNRILSELKKLNAEDKLNKTNLNNDKNDHVEEKNSLSLLNKISEINPFDDPVYRSKRSKLPERKPVKMNFWAILKDSIGKELYKISVPVYFNEPLSMLQRLCENFQYADLLTKASKDIRSYMRLAYTAAFALGGFSYSQYRILKFFNPLLGETYELIDKDLKFRYFSEQVSHHPPISACYAEGEGYIFYTNSHALSKFHIMKGALEISPLGKVFVNFTNLNETLSYTKPKALVKNLIKGKMHINTYGTLRVTNHMNGDYCEITIYDDDSNQKGKFDGSVKNIFGDVLAKIEGNVYSHMDVITEQGKETIWKAFTCDDEAKYFFTEFAMNLNNFNEDMKDTLPPTDSRFRPDQRALELGNYDLAAKEKERLEVNQRKRNKLQSSKGPYKALYFTETYDDETGELVYLYNNDKCYWKDRNEKNFEKFPKIFENL